MRRAQFFGHAGDGLERDGGDGKCDGAVAVRDDCDSEPIDCDGGNAECGIAWMLVAGSEHGKRQPGRDGISVFGCGRDGAGGRPNVRGGYDGLPHG